MKKKKLQEPTLLLNAQNNDVKIMYIDSAPEHILTEGKKIPLDMIKDKKESIQKILKDDATVVLGNPIYHLIILSKSGTINVRNFKGKNLTIQTNEGQITIYDTVTRSLTATTENANIQINNVIAENIGLKTKDGKVKVTNNESLITTITTTNGMVDMNNILCSTQLKVNTKNGNTIGQNILAQELQETTTNGDITLINIASNTMQVHSTEGNITLNLADKENAYQSFFNSDNGNINIVSTQESSKVKTRGQKKLSATTTNGNIHIHYSEN